MVRRCRLVMRVASWEIWAEVTQTQNRRSQGDRASGLTVPWVKRPKPQVAYGRGEH
jgi:hypothetical protein